VGGAERWGGTAFRNGVRRVRNKTKVGKLTWEVRGFITSEQPLYRQDGARRRDSGLRGTEGTLTWWEK